MTAFALDSRLEADTLPVARLELSQLRLMNDRRFPWLVLVPERGGITEIFDLEPGDRTLLMEEAARAGEVLKQLTGAGKINVGALGNVVAQLHVHIVARSEADAAWPGPVWGAGSVEPYPEGEAEALARRIAAAMARS